MNWKLLGVASMVAGLVACSPALNWRTVPWPEAALRVTLPCKPDHATRTVEIAGAAVALSMVGCEADGATFAVSSAPWADGSQAGAALAHWRAAVLARMGAAAATAEAPFAPAGSLPLPQAVRLSAHGRAVDGRIVHAQAVWFVRPMGPEMRLYHAVVYTDKPRPDVADAFIAGMALQ